MARGRKTGGKSFGPDHKGGRPKGSKDRVPRTTKVSITAAFAKVISEDPTLLEDSIRRGLKAKVPANAPFIRMAREFLEGRPREQPSAAAVEPRHVKIVMEEMYCIMKKWVPSEHLEAEVRNLGFHIDQAIHAAEAKAGTNGNAVAT